MKKGFHIPTYDEAKNIVSTTGELVFYESAQEVDGYKVSTFNYRLASYNDFLEYKANELRGLCFVFNEDGSLYNRYVLLHKFYNVNQVEETQFALLKDEPILAVHNKADGSVISFVRLPNGNAYAKTKMVVRDNPQANMAQEIYERNESIRRLVDYTLDNDIVAIFELVSPFNRVVLKYTDTDLVLLRLRDNKTGQYLPLDTVGDYLNGVNVVEDETHIYKSWDDIFTMMSTAEDKEGCVITLPSGLCKTKTQWYCDRHNLFTDFVNREDYLIDLVLDEKIDDVLGQLGESDTEVRALVDIVSERVHSYLADAMSQINTMIDEYYTVYNCDRKAFSFAYAKKSMYFTIAVKAIEKTEAEKALKNLTEDELKQVEMFIHMNDVMIKSVVDKANSNIVTYLNDEVVDTDRRSLLREYAKEIGISKDNMKLANSLLASKDTFFMLVEFLKDKCYFLGNARHFIRTGEFRK
jgi:T4 RnlA family RNA ligase